MNNKRGTTRILILGSGTQALAILKGLTEAGGRLYIVVNKTGNYGDESKYIYKRYVCSIPVGSSAYLDYVKKLILSNKIDVVIPTGDITAGFASKYKKEFDAITNISIPDFLTFQKGYDKNQLMNLCQEKGYPHPKTIDLSKCCYLEKSLFQGFPFPGLLKPNCTTGGRGMTMIADYDDLLRKYPNVYKEYGDCHLQRLVREGGRQIKVQLYVEEDGTLIASSVLNKVRWYPVKGGSSCCAITIKNDEIVRICHNVLKDIKWVGFADFDIIEDPDTSELLIMEINPRLPACIGASVYAGINWGEIIMRDAMGLGQKTYNYKVNVVLRHLCLDILWFIHSPNRYNTKPSWFCFWGRNVHYQDFHFFDQKPFWIGTYHNIKKLFNPSFKRAKSGM